MTATDSTSLAETFPLEAFDIDGLQDEIRADRLCQQLLRRFAADLATGAGLPPAEAGALAHGADYFLREFMIDDRRENPFRLRAGRVRQFADTWYIIRNLEPNLAELTDLLEGVMAAYHYFGEQGLVSTDLAQQVRGECEDLEFYRERIESFWAIEEGGYPAWESRCSLKD